MEVLDGLETEKKSARKEGYRSFCPPYASWFDSVLAHADLFQLIIKSDSDSLSGNARADSEQVQVKLVHLLLLFVSVFAFSLVCSESTYNKHALVTLSQKGCELANLL